MGSNRRYVGVVLATVVLLALGWVASADADIYWGCYSGGYCPIGHANVKGGDVKPSFITGSNYVYGVAVDGRYVYWGNGGGTTAIGRASLDGSAANQSFIKGEPTYPHGLAVDGAHIYWANTNTGTIGRANLDGSGVDQSFITGLGYPVAVAVDGAHIYWATGSGGGSPQNPEWPGLIGRANLDGSAANPAFITATLPSVSSARGQGGPWGLAVDGAHIYWDNGDFGYIYGRPTKYAIGRANLDGSGVNLSFIANAGANGPAGVAVDGAHIYWASPSSRTIARANLDGSGVNLSFIASVYAGALAVNAVSTDTRPPVVSLLSARLSGGKTGKLITIVVSCPAEACTVMVTGTVNAPGASAATRFALGKATKAIAKGAPATMPLTIPGNASQAIMRALRRGEKATVTVTVAARDAAGNTATRRRTIKLKLRG